MPSINVNLADVDSFDPMPEDDYDIEIVKVEVRKNKAGDGLYLNWEMVILDGEFENRRLWMITSLKSTALFRLKAVLVDLEVVDGDEDLELEYDDDVEPDTSGGPLLLYPELEGIEAIATVKNEMYDGKERNRVEGLRTGKAKKKTRKTAAAASKGTKSTSRRTSDEEEDDDEDDEEEDEQPARRARASSRSSSNSNRTSSRRRRMR